jgi:hypothetical protein
MTGSGITAFSHKTVVDFAVSELRLQRRSEFDELATVLEGEAIDEWFLRRSR